MTVQLITAAALVLMLIGVAWKVRSSGKESEKLSNMKELEDALVKAGKIEQAVATESNPSKRLHDEWSRD